MNRRCFLTAMMCGAAAAALPSRIAQAQTSGMTTVMGLTKNGYPAIATSVNGVPLTRGQRAVLSRVGSQVARTAASRAAANATFSTIARAVIMNAPRAGLYGIAAAAAIGGAYYLITGQNPLDPLMNLTFGGSGMFVKYPCSCAEVPTQTGSYPDTVTMGFYKQSSCSNTAYYRIAVQSSVSSSSNSSPGGEWSWAHTENLGGGKFRHFYTRSVFMDPATCGNSYVALPGNTDFGKTLSTADKLKALSGAALDALGLSAWSWTADPALGGGGSTGGGGATGGWFNPPQDLKDKITKAPLGDGPIIDPLPYTGDEDDIAPTVGEVLEPLPTQGDPGNFEFPNSIKFPGESGYTPPTGGGGTPNPEPTTEPTTTPSTTPTGTTPPYGTGGPVDPTAPDELPPFEAFVAPLTDVFEPVAQAFNVGGVGCPSVTIPSWGIYGASISAFTFDYHCQLFEPLRGSIVTASTALGGWMGVKKIMEA